MTDKKPCPDCGVKPQEAHQRGCDVERCALCGEQAIGNCHCVYELNGVKYSTCDETHPEIYEGGPPEEWYVAYDAKVDSSGGPAVWEGTWPGAEECRKYGLWSYWDEEKRMWIKCDKDHPKAGEDLNTLYALTFWNPVTRRRENSRRGWV